MMEDHPNALNVIPRATCTRLIVLCPRPHCLDAPNELFATAARQQLTQSTFTIEHTKESCC